MANERSVPSGTRQFNKIASRAAGKKWMPLWGLVQHRGRKSGASYETPIAIVSATDAAIYVGLPWGRKTDWIRNLQANGGTLVWKGGDIPVTTIEFADADEAVAAANKVVQVGVNRWGMSDFLKIHRV